MTDTKNQRETKPERARPMDAGLAMIARLSPEMGTIVSALSTYQDSMPTEVPANASAFEALSGKAPRLAQAITAYVQSGIHHGESFTKVTEDACRAVFGLAPMTDAEEIAWIHRHDVKPVTTFSRDPTKGPTVAEWVAAGYSASNYPPTGYEPRSSKEEIAAAVAKERDTKELGPSPFVASDVHQPFVGVGNPAREPFLGGPPSH